MSGRKYGKCEFARLLENRYGLSRDEIKKWVCIAQYESEFKTGAINRANSDGSTDYGIFQINNRWWCNDGSYPSKNGCNTSCSSLMTADISNSMACAQTVRSQQGFGAWVAYNNKCANRNLDQYMAECWGGN